MYPLADESVRGAMEDIELERRTGRILLVSCLGDDTGGGLFACDGVSLEAVDRVSSTGLWTDGERLLRVLRSPDQGGAFGELLLYDARGVSRYLRVDQVRDPHDIVFDGQSFVVVSSMTNSIVWLSTAGEVQRTWTAPGTGDAWHINGLLLHDGRLFACAFGRYHDHRSWSADLEGRKGIVFEVESGCDVLGGLSCPHHPRFIDEAWVVCNSGAGELLQVEAASGATRRRLQLRGWTRGLAVSDDFLFVGESAHRSRSGPEDTATVVVVDRGSWLVLDRIPVPSREIYDLVLAPRSLLEGARRGFRTNDLRCRERDQLALFEEMGVQPVRLWAVGEPLPREACRVRIEADLDRELAAGEMLELQCRVENLGGAILVSAPPNPVHLSYRWSRRSSGTEDVVEGLRSRLAGALPPGGTRTCNFLLKTPAEEGDYLLTLTVVQEQVAWFDELDGANAWTAWIRVRSAASPETDRGGADRPRLARETAG